MKYTETIQEITKGLNELQLDEFQINSNKEGLSFVKINNTTTNEFGIRILNNPDHQIFISFNAGVNYHEIERVIVPILQESEIVGNSMNPKTAWTIKLSSEVDLMNSVNQYNSKLPLEIRQKEEINIVVKMIDNLYTNTFTKLFNRYRTNEHLYNKIKDKSYKEIGSILTSGAVFKYFYIANQFHRDDTKTKFKTWLNNIKVAIKNNPNEIQYKRFEKAGELLANELKYAM